jgi:D-glycerate 3-kinase
MKLGTETL